jgi:chromosome segregation ATPase
MSDFAAESLQETLAAANKVAAAYGPLGGSLGILELKGTFEAMKASLQTMAQTLAAVDNEIQAKRAYSTALETHIAHLEERRRQLEEHTTPEERRLQGRLSELEQRLSLLDERRRQAESITQQGVDDVARWLRSVRAGG